MFSRPPQEAAELGGDDFPASQYQGWRRKPAHPLGPVWWPAGGPWWWLGLPRGRHLPAVQAVTALVAAAWASAVWTGAGGSWAGLAAADPAAVRAAGLAAAAYATAGLLVWLAEVEARFTERRAAGCVPAVVDDLPAGFVLAFTRTAELVVTVAAVPAGSRQISGARWVFTVRAAVAANRLQVAASGTGLLAFADMPVLMAELSRLPDGSAEQVAGVLARHRAVDLGRAADG